MTAQVQDRTLLGSAVRRPAQETLAGLGVMSRLFWRRNRVRLVVWAVFVIAMVGYVVSYYQSLFTTQEALDDFARVSDTPGLKALTGLAANPATMGGAVWTKIWMFVAIALALGAVFLVTRNGRADEETGRTELLRSRVLGLHAGSLATWLWVGGLCVVSGVGAAIVCIAMGLDPAGADVLGSLVFGLSITGVGLFGLGVGALAGQVTSTSRGANALGSVVVIAFYVVRMVGDLGDGTLTWASPIGWGQEMQPWGANRWWPLGLLVVLTVALLALAGWLEGRRDHGAGLLPERLGNPGAPQRWTSPLGLALRLQRGPVVGWTVAVVIAAGLFGSVVQSMTDLLDDAGGSATDLVGGTGVDALLSMLTGMIALVVAVFAVQSAVALRGDEASAILEPQLAGAVGRVRWAAERLVIPVVGSAVLLAVGGGIFGASYGSTVSDASQAGRLAGAALVYWPAIMVLVGVAVLLFGYLPRLAVPLSWGVIAAVWFLMFVGDALGLPQGLLDILPWSATPYVPMEPLTWTPLVVMTLVAVVFTVLGVTRFRRRDIQPA
ncbi:ABC transporter permease [Xylanimonas protaetiae]|uniref:ABC transporter permease n=1 Tax=Xylanimonas protaetiae TaxID=2509457 RepID=A0A4V0YG93_9MICO|nr:ABC transporter permease [Xylanimonas protaetiae]QAY70411.1 ABC transporter permease [Xylanimonas protaetiae]